PGGFAQRGPGGGAADAVEPCLDLVDVRAEHGDRLLGLVLARDQVEAGGERLGFMFHFHCRIDLSLGRKKSRRSGGGLGEESLGHWIRCTLALGWRGWVTRLTSMRSMSSSILPWGTRR